MFAVTERLLLRPGWVDDAPALHAAFGVPEVTMKLASAPWPYELQHAEAYLALPRAPGEASFLIFDRKRGSAGLIGGIGIHELDSEWEIGYWIAPQYWGKGYATEAGRAVVAIARDTLRIRKLVSGHFVDNPASGHVLRKIGFKPTGRIEPRANSARGTDVPCVLFEQDLLGDSPPAEMPVRTPQMQMMLAA